MSIRTDEQIRDIIKAFYTGTATDAETDDYTLQALPNFIEGIAAIEDEFGGLSLGFTDRLWGGVIIRAWQRWDLAVQWVRDQPDAEQAFKNFEDLAKRLKARRDRLRQRGGVRVGRIRQDVETLTHRAHSLPGFLGG